MAVIFPKQDKELNLFCILSGANADVETSQAALGRGGRRAASDFFRTQAQKRHWNPHRAMCWRGWEARRLWGGIQEAQESKMRRIWSW